jgi:hypothetical protein
MSILHHGPHRTSLLVAPHVTRDSQLRGRMRGLPVKQGQHTGKESPARTHLPEPRGNAIRDSHDGLHR